MANTSKKSKAISLRKAGKSYSQIKKELNVSKSTLSYWLADLPLSPERIRELRDNSAERIEHYRNTMKEKRDKRLNKVYEKVKSDLGNLTEKEIILCGLFLYWGEGEKSLRPSVSLSNTDPSMLRFYLVWLETLGVDINDLKIILHIYADMDKEESVRFWSEALDVPRNCFRKVYVKKSKLLDLSYKNGFGHGTCMIRYGSQQLKNYIMMALKHFGDLYS